MAKKQAEFLKWVGDGQGIHWPTVDEDVSVMGLLAGPPLVESKAALV